MALSGSLAIMAFRKPFNVCFARLYLFLFSRARNFCQFMALIILESGEEVEFIKEGNGKSRRNCYKFNGTQTQVQWKSTEREEIFQRPKFPFRSWCEKIALMKFCEELLQWDFLLGECLRCKLALIGLAASINVSNLGINVSNPSFQHKFPLSLPAVFQIRVGAKSLTGGYS